MTDQAETGLTVGHTPGPWEVSEEGDGHVILMGTARTSRGAHDVQHVITYDHGLFEDDEGAAAEQYAEACANAWLIAAAPDLLAALKALKDHVASEMTFTNDGAGWQPDDLPLAQIMTAAEEAIAKATGS